MLTAVEKSALCADYAARVKSRVKKRARTSAREYELYLSGAIDRRSTKRAYGKHIKTSQA